VSRIVICHCNRPAFLSIQIDAYRNACIDLEEIIIVNDGASLELRSQISEICKKSGVTCLNAPIDLDHSSANVACASVLQWAYDLVQEKHKGGKFAFFDSDMFPLASFQISDYLSGNVSFSALRQDRNEIDYPWNGIFFIDFDRIPGARSINWYCGVVSSTNVDCGGLTNLHFRKYDRHHLKYITHTSHMSMKQISSLVNCPPNIAMKYKEEYKLEVIDEKFLHYGSASNWKTDWLSPVDFTKSKTDFVLEWLRSVGVIV